MDPLPRDCFLVTADVVSLYTNIPHEEGISTVLESISENLGNLPMGTLPIASIKILLKYILEFNVFEFLGEFFQQIFGTAMGTKCAPSYACIFMSKIEAIILKLSKHILHWKRFIDDIFFIFVGNEEELQNLLQKMNKVHRTIKFTFNHSKTSVNFLDTIVNKDKNGYIFTNLYTKPTDTFSLLHFDSYHPLSTKKSIVYSQALRYRMVITKQSDLMKALSNLEFVLTCRKYPKNLIWEQFNRVISLTQSEVLRRNQEQSSTESNNLVFSTLLTPNQNQILQILKNRWGIIENDDSLRNVWPHPPMVATMRHKNLKETLIQSKLNV